MLLSPNAVHVQACDKCGYTVHTPHPPPVPDTCRVRALEATVAQREHEIEMLCGEACKWASRVQALELALRRADDEANALMDEASSLREEVFRQENALRDGDAGRTRLRVKAQGLSDELFAQKRRAKDAEDVAEGLRGQVSCLKGEVVEMLIVQANLNTMARDSHAREHTEVGRRVMAEAEVDRLRGVLARHGVEPPRPQMGGRGRGQGFQGG